MTGIKRRIFSRMAAMAMALMICASMILMQAAECQKVKADVFSTLVQWVLAAVGSDGTTIAETAVIDPEAILLLGGTALAAGVTYQRLEDLKTYCNGLYQYVHDHPEYGATWQALWDTEWQGTKKISIALTQKGMEIVKDFIKTNKSTYDANQIITGMTYLGQVTVAPDVYYNDFRIQFTVPTDGDYFFYINAEHGTKLNIETFLIQSSTSWVPYTPYCTAGDKAIYSPVEVNIKDGKLVNNPSICFNFPTTAGWKIALNSGSDVIDFYEKQQSLTVYGNPAGVQVDSTGNVKSANDTLSLDEPIGVSVDDANAISSADVIGVGAADLTKAGDMTISNTTSTSVPTTNDPTTDWSNATHTLDFSPLENIALLDKFPFCLPWDLKNLVSALVATPQAPSWTIDISMSAFHLPNWQYVVDFSKYEPVVLVIRWGMLILVTVGLIFGGYKLFKH